MKKSLFFAAGIAVLSLTTSCNKCATCTYNDPEKGTLTAEVCSNGHANTSAIEAYEENDWNCAN